MEATCVEIEKEAKQGTTKKKRKRRVVPCATWGGTSNGTALGEICFSFHSRRTGGVKFSRRRVGEKLHFCRNV